MRVERVLVVQVERLLGARQLVEVDSVERPPVRCRDLADLVARLGEGHVEDALAFARPCHEELERERRLADPRLALHEVETVRRQPATEDVVEPFYAGAVPRCDPNPRVSCDHKPCLDRTPTAVDDRMAARVRDRLQRSIAPAVIVARATHRRASGRSQRAISASMASAISGDSGGTLLGQAFTGTPSLPTRYLWKFHFGGPLLDESSA